MVYYRHRKRTILLPRGNLKMGIRRNTSKRALLAGINKAIDELFSAKRNLQNGEWVKFLNHLYDAVNMVNLVEMGAMGTQVSDLEEPTDEHGFVKDQTT